MALAVPPSVFAVHIQFNLVYQFWIHTEVIRDMGPLEWVLNTPSHHRVHHSTFAPDGDKVVYGLVHKINTFEVLHIQMLSQLTVLMMTGYILLSLTSIGFIIDQNCRSTASMLELLRCVLTVMLLRYGYMTAPAPLVVPIEAFVSISLLYWGLQTFSQLIAVKQKTT
ncbi:alkylglycerol monooxygenase-like [Oncorhynchus mykiss]|uniref:alkylglycerol monooxygenase-like n=1 Tax=Oncorhynchus mykiss TaxID=8022 RepID=UPI001878D8FD|nr:alkylglycerol monooxygenase-like [Oncorhynchus mykiss]